MHAQHNVYVRMRLSALHNKLMYFFRLLHFALPTWSSASRSAFFSVFIRRHPSQGFLVWTELWTTVHTSVDSSVSSRGEPIGELDPISSVNDYLHPLHEDTGTGALSAV